jgi:hypothetical protein
MHGQQNIKYEVACPLECIVHYVGHIPQFYNHKNAVTRFCVVLENYGQQEESSHAKKFKTVQVGMLDLWLVWRGGNW